MTAVGRTLAPESVYKLELMSANRMMGGVSVVELLKRAARECWDDGVFGLAASLAFYHFMAVFPAILIVLIPLAHLSSHGSAMEGMLKSRFGQVLPEDAAALVVNAIGDLERNARFGGLLLSVGAVGALWASMNASLAMIVGLNQAYETQEDREWWRVAVIAAALGAAVIGLVFAALLATRLGEVVIGDAEGALRGLLQWSAMVVILMASFALFYRFGPNLKKHKWKWSLPGAAVAALLWTAATILMRAYFNEFAPYRQIYGRVAPAAMLLLWLYLTSATVLIGAELNSEIEKARKAGGLEPGLRRGEPAKTR